MLKFFRKYTKHLLVAVTILILISWLLGSTLSALLRPKPGMEIIATAYGEEVKLNDLNQARFRADIMTRLGLLWQKPWIVSRRQLLGDAQPPLTPNSSKRSTESGWDICTAVDHDIGLTISRSDLPASRRTGNPSRSDLPVYTSVSPVSAFSIVY